MNTPNPNQYCIGKCITQLSFLKKKKGVQPNFFLKEKLLPNLKYFQRIKEKINRYFCHILETNGYLFKSKLAKYTNKCGISLNGGKMVMLGEENWRDIEYGVQIGKKWCVGSTNLFCTSRHPLFNNFLKKYNIKKSQKNTRELKERIQLKTGLDIY